MKYKKKRTLIKAISDIYRISSTYVSEKADKYCIGRGQWYYLNQLLFGQDGITQEELSKRMYVDKSNTARALKKLEENGYITRQSSSDARKKMVFVTDKAKEIRDDYHGIFKNINMIMTDGFTPEEQEQVERLIYRMRDNLVDYMEKKHYF